MVVPRFILRCYRTFPPPTPTLPRHFPRHLPHHLPHHLPYHLPQQHPPALTCLMAATQAIMLSKPKRSVKVPRAVHMQGRSSTTVRYLNSSTSRGKQVQTLGVGWLLIENRRGRTLASSLVTYVKETKDPSHTRARRILPHSGLSVGRMRIRFLDPLCFLLDLNLGPLELFVQFLPEGTCIATTWAV